MFPNFADCVQETGINISPLITTVAQQFCVYFTEDFSSFAWVRDPFSCPGKYLPVDMGEQLVELKSDTRLREVGIKAITTWTATHLQLFLSAVILVERDA